MKFKNLFLAFFCTIFMSCTNAGTEIGNPTLTTRDVTGILSDTSDTALLRVESDETSCPEENGAITVVFRERGGERLEVEPEDGVFTGSLERDRRYEIIFEQDGEECGYLVYETRQPQAGLRVTLGRGLVDIDLGSIVDLGNGVFVPENNPSNFCDDDEDDVSDTDDDDDDGDGFDDDDTDFDGYIDWFDDEGEQDPDGEIGCRVERVYPSRTSGMELDESGAGELAIHLDQEISDVENADIQILDANDNVVIDGLADDVLEIGGSGRNLEAEVTLEPFTDYVLVIPAGTFTCNDEFPTLEETRVEFFTFTED